jgi:hypothetical protein
VKFTSTVNKPLDVRNRVGRERAKPQYRYLPTRRQKGRGTPEWFANASHLDLVTGWDDRQRRREPYDRAAVYLDRFKQLRDGSHNIKVARSGVTA